MPGVRDRVESMLGGSSQSEIARMVGVSRQRVHQIKNNPLKAGKGHWSQDDLAMLGRVPDKVMAAARGVKQATIRAKRQKLGIPSYSTYFWKLNKPLLGTMLDANLAQLLGVHRQTVINRRKKYGIPPFREPGRPRSGEVI